MVDVIAWMATYYSNKFARALLMKVCFGRVFYFLDKKSNTIAMLGGVIVEWTL